MPKKSDRASHGTAMSQLLPDVSLEEDDDKLEATDKKPSQDNSSKELQNYRTNEDADGQSSDPQSQSPQQDAEPSRRGGRLASRSSLSVVPAQRPSLGQKLGPYVSDEVDAALEDVYLTLRRKFGGEASKSLIVEAALRYALTDCLEREEDSELVRWFDEVLSRS